MQTMAEKEIERYIKAVRHRLRCNRETKDILCAGLRQEIEDNIEDGKITRQNLRQAFGSEHDAAAELQEGVAPDEARNAIKRRNCIIAIAVVVFAIIVTMVVIEAIHIWRVKSVYYIETIF